MDKKGFILSYADLFKGLVVGFILGAVLMYLVTNGIIHIPFLSPT
jgi:hypothetical protein